MVVCDVMSHSEIMYINTDVTRGIILRVDVDKGIRCVQGAASDIPRHHDLSDDCVNLESEIFRSFL